MDIELLIWLLGDWECLKRQLVKQTLTQEIRPPQKQVAIPDANSVMVLTVFRVKDTMLSSF